MSNPFQKAFHWIHRHTWSNFLRASALRAYYRRDFQSFDHHLKQIRPYDPEFANFGQLFKRQLLEGNVSIGEWQGLLASVENKPVHTIVKRKIYSEVITKSLHDQNPKQAMEWLQKKNEKFGFQSGDIGFLQGILKLYLKEKNIDRTRSTMEWIHENFKNSKWASRIKLKLMEIFLELEGSDKFDRPAWKIAFERLEKFDLPLEEKEYFLKLKTIYEKLETRHRLLLDIRTSQKEQNEFLELIRSKLIDRVPFLFIRLGDGESYGFDFKSDHASKGLADRHARERKWWGETLTDEIRQKLILRFQETLKDADVVGIPSLFRFIRDAFEKPTKLFSLQRLKPKNTLRGIQVVMDAVDDAEKMSTYSSKVWFIEHRSHQVMFTKEKIQDLGKHASKVIIVSNHEAAAIKNFFTGLSVHHIQIPKERLGKQSLPYKMDEIIAIVAGSVTPGSLVLISAGFSGKYLLKVARDRGGVALDVGSMTDYWMGLKTRQVADIV